MREAQSSGVEATTEPDYVGGSWREMIRKVEFWAHRDEVVIRVEGHLPCDAKTGRPWRGDFFELYGEGELLDDVDEALLDAATQIARRPAPFDPLRVYRLRDGGYAMQLDLCHPWTLDEARQVVPGARWEGAVLIDPVELPARERTLLAPWEAVVDRLCGFGPAFADIDEAALADGPVEPEALCDVDGRRLPGRPLRGMRLQVVHGSLPGERVTYRVRRASARSFDVAGDGGTSTFATVDWPRWLARRGMEGLVHMCLPGCDRDRCYGCDGSVVGAVADKGEKARIAAVVASCDVAQRGASR